MDRHDPRFSEHGTAELEHQVGAIRGELGQLGDSHDWAGEYVDGSDDSFARSRWLLLAPRSGFAFQQQGEYGIGDQRVGRVQQEGDTLVLLPTLTSCEAAAILARAASERGALGSASVPRRR